MLSVFNKRKVQKKITSIAGGRRAQSPPSPASFASPDIHEKARLHTLHSDEPAQPRLYDSGRTSIPRVQLDLNYRESYSDWFPAELLQGERREPPERNASLPCVNGSTAAIAGPGTDSSWTREVSSTTSVDDIIIIEPQSQGSREQPQVIDLDDGSELHGSGENSSQGPSRKPTPAPIKIPENPTGSKIKIQLSASAGASAGPSSHLPVPGSNGPTRPASPASVYTDDMSSSVSGTTLARALVGSAFILTNDSRASRYRSGVTRQDSATLPRGEHSFTLSRRDHRTSNSDAEFVGSPESGLRSSIPPVPPLPPSAQLSGGLSSANTNGTMVESRRIGTELPYPLEASASGRRSMPRPPEDRQAISQISPISEASSSAPSAPYTPLFVEGSSSDNSAHSLTQSFSNRRSVDSSKIQTSSSSLDSGHVGNQRFSVSHAGLSIEASSESHGRAEAWKQNKHNLDLTVKGSMFSPGPETASSGSVYSSTTFERHDVSTPGTSVKSHGSTSHSSPSRSFVPRARSDSSVPRNNSATYRPIILLPIGERPRSVQVPHSPMSSRSPSDTDLRFRTHAGAPSVPVTARLSGDTPTESPDLLDFMFPVTRSTLVRGPSGRGRSGTVPAPLAVASKELPAPLRSSSMESLVPVTANLQTFPETPYAFSPLYSAHMSPMPPLHPSAYPPPLPRTVSVNRGGVADTKMRLAQRTPLLRSSSFTVFSSGQSPSTHVPPTPPPSADSNYVHSPPTSGISGGSVDGHSPAQLVQPLASIEEAHTRSNTPSHSPSPEPSRRASPSSREPPGAVLWRENSASAGSLLMASGDISATSSQSHSRSHSPLRPPLPVPPAGGSEGSQNSVPLPVLCQSEESLGSPPPSYAVCPEPSFSTPAPAMQVTTEANDVLLSSNGSGITQSAPENLTIRASVLKESLGDRVLSPLPSPPSSAALPPLPPSPISATDETRIMLERPPPPYVEEVSRPVPQSPVVAVPPGGPIRAGTPEVAISKRTPRTRPPLPIGPRRPLASTRSRNGSVSSFMSNPSGPSTMRKASTLTLSASSPKFQTTPVKFRGLTKEAAEWTFTSQQLQQLVSTAIKQTADVSAIRLLPLDILNGALPDEIHRLEVSSAELRTNYKLNVRKRRQLLGYLTSMVDGLEPSDNVEALRKLEELSEVTDHLDQLAEELYDVTVQLGQLTHLRDVHSSSALIMALHKLNNSLKKHLAEGQKLREQVTTLEAERDEAWRQAQEVAQDFDDLADRTSDPVSSTRDGSSSRRSSRVLVARKNSAWATRAGLRTSVYRRSHRSSTSVSSVHRNSAMASPAMRSAGMGDIPPVPPIPLRTAIGIVTDLPTSRSSMAFSSESPSSEFRAMAEAQKELCDMLGISLEDLRSQHPSRRQSMSAAVGTKSPTSDGRVRRNSEVVSVNQRTPASARTSFKV
ncbi:hypothetical protein AcV7_002241 [Taiwanofungus camphoratus]|nr:hypothetical protein AcV7_002241 [Antrodia cinnamomea]